MSAEVSAEPKRKKRSEFNADERATATVHAHVEPLSGDAPPIRKRKKRVECEDADEAEAADGLAQADVSTVSNEGVTRARRRADGTGEALPRTRNASNAFDISASIEATHDTVADCNAKSVRKQKKQKTHAVEENAGAVGLQSDPPEAEACDDEVLSMKAVTRKTKRRHIVEEWTDAVAQDVLPDVKPDDDDADAKKAARRKKKRALAAQEFEEEDGQSAPSATIAPCGDVDVDCGSKTKVKRKNKQSALSAEELASGQATETPATDVGGGGFTTASANDCDDVPRSTGGKKRIDKCEGTSCSIPTGTGGREAVLVDERGGPTSVLLFYQYVEPMWSPEELKEAMQWARDSATQLEVTGRVKAAREGLNCTLTGSAGAIRRWCRGLRAFSKFFKDTEFKITDGLPSSVMWNTLDVFQADELVGYGLDYDKAPSTKYSGVHLDPEEYHRKMEEENTVIIDVRNTYEAEIGRFDPRYDGPARSVCGAKAAKGGAEYINPMMRRSTDWPQWLQQPETVEKLRGKQVMMFCTGGIRCERASALFNLQLGDQVKGVYQCQGGVDKYLKAFPDGGHFIGKNYVFDKRWEQGPGVWELEKSRLHEVMGRCLSCDAPWDDFRQQRRCATCGVPVLVCETCVGGDTEGTTCKLRCRACQQDGAVSKALCRKEERERNAVATEKVREILRKASDRGLVDVRGEGAETGVAADAGTDATPPRNCTNVTRLFVAGLNTKKISEASMVETFKGVTHIQWLRDKDTGSFYGSCFLEMGTAAEAAAAVELNGREFLGRKIKVKFEPMKVPGRWPPLGSAIGSCGEPHLKAVLGPPPFPKCRKFFIRGVSPKATDDDVRWFFAPSEPQAMRWMTIKETGAFRGCGHVDFRTASEAQTAATKHGQKLLGQAVTLEWAA
eukprot:TRINITY_DN19981_c0_g1_i1.p1 TRINITY_DN19981_c0_g1~~TRINITY_DN19981_c0_g1_i1.p1  ORF type:complete len:901 (+),score=173.63 TRINITY_DN19981_c0_g1_i1:132-2834(+)